ncbi:MAG: flagellar motor protein MotB [Kofleriaceae bacterium]
MAEPAKRKVIKKGDGHGHHGGAWKVAYADFVTAMMALFMVLWLLASSDAQTRKEIANYFRTGIMPEGDLSMNRAAQITPSVVEAAPQPPPPGQESITNDTVDKLRSEMIRLGQIDAAMAEVLKGVHVEITKDGVLIEIVDEGKDLLFDTSSSKLKGPLTQFLKDMGPILDKTGAAIEINGHTDAAPFGRGSKISNWDLSYQRASASREILVAAGLDDKKIAGVFARGSSQPYVKTDPYAPQNRRISILVKVAKSGGATKTVPPAESEKALVNSPDPIPPTEEQPKDAPAHESQ